jgi:hypothetical protein
MYDALIKGDYDTWRNVPNEKVEESGWQSCATGGAWLGQWKSCHKTPAHHTFLESWLMNSNKTFALYDPR